MSDNWYYWAWWATEIKNPVGELVKILKGIEGYELSEPELISRMASLGKSRNEYEIHKTKHYGESQVKHEINALIAHKIGNIDAALMSRYKTTKQNE